jgi:hypothetical protein
MNEELREQKLELDWSCSTKELNALFDNIFFADGVTKVSLNSFFSRIEDMKTYLETNEIPLPEKPKEMTALEKEQVDTFFLLCVALEKARGLSQRIGIIRDETQIKFTPEQENYLQKLRTGQVLSK